MQIISTFSSIFLFIGDSLFLLEKPLFRYQGSQEGFPLILLLVLVGFLWFEYLWKLFVKILCCPFVKWILLICYYVWIWKYHNYYWSIYTFSVWKLSENIVEISKMYLHLFPLLLCLFLLLLLLSFVEDWKHTFQSSSNI